MQYNGVPLRHELKYSITMSDYYRMRSLIEPFVHRDSHAGENGYFIRSLYFDDVFSSGYYEKESGIERRRKYRIRIYNLSDRSIKFEIKDKLDSYIAKLSASITREECERMIAQDYSFMLDSESRAMRMGYIDARTKLLHPMVVVDYDRDAFVCSEGNVRITFDMNVRAGIASYDIFDADMVTVPALEDGRIILEVKYDDYLPSYIRQLLRPVNSWQLSQSKYAMCVAAKNTFRGKEIPYVFY